MHYERKLEMDLRTTSLVKKTRRSVLGRQTFKVQEFANKVQQQSPKGAAGSSDVWNWPASFRCIKDQSIEHEISKLQLW
jgi:hypothetical protein